MNEQTDFAKQLGALTEAVNSLKDRLERDREDKRYIDTDASEHREQFHKELSSIKEYQKNIDHKTDDLIRRVDEIEPITKMVSSWQMRWTGAVIVLGFLGTMVTAGWVIFKTQIIHVFTGEGR